MRARGGTAAVYPFGRLVADPLDPARASPHPAGTVPANPERQGSLAVAVAATLWGGWGLVLDAAGLPGPQAGCLALFTIAVGAAPLLPRRIPRARLDWALLGAIGVCDAGNTLLFFQALRRGPIGIAVLSHYLAPILVALLSPLILRALPSRTTLIALPVSLAGLVLLLGPDALAVGAAGTTAALGAGSAVFYALNVVLSKGLARRLAPAEVLVWHVIISALLLLPFALAFPAPTLRGAALVVGGAVVSGVGGGFLFLWGLARIPASRAGVLSYLEPVVGVTLGALVLGERMPAWGPVGVAMVLGAGLVVTARS